jgi:hypothetical protein
VLRGRMSVQLYKLLLVWQDNHGPLAEGLGIPVDANR